MKALTAEWVVKAEGDFDSMLRECKARKRPNFDAACFHAQQCCEKYLKARLCESAKPIPKTHDLVKLLELVLAFEPLWELHRKGLGFLTDYAVKYRYPGESADRSEARESMQLCKEFRLVARTALGLGIGAPRRKTRRR